MVRFDPSNKNELSPIINRPMTWTDLLYIACESVLKNKHIMCTRYPILDEYGTFISKIRISSTTKTIPMVIDGVFYKYYPNIDFSIPEDNIGIYFIDSMRFSHSYLPGLDGDYDGDTITCKIAFTQEADEELENYIYKKENFINASGDLIRKIENEALQTFYVLTKNPDKEEALSKEAIDFFINTKSTDYTFDNMISWFGKYANIDKSKSSNGISIKPKYNIYTYFDYEYKKGEVIHTTLGKFVYNKVMIQNLGFDKVFGYINDEFTEGRFSKFEAALTNALKDDKITTRDMIKYIDTRDWFGLSMHGVITSSFTPAVIKTPKEVLDLKEELFKKYAKEIAEGNTAVVAEIEKALINKEMEVLKGDVGLDLYTSGARGSVGNNLKNINLIRGSVYNNLTGKFDIVKNSLMDMLDKDDFTPHVNTIVTGSYARGVGTREGGYLTKQLIQVCSPETLGPKDSDCGSKGYIVITLTNENAKMYMYRYMISSSGELILLTSDNINKYIGKEIKIRSPQYCLGIGGNQHCICNKCMGDEFYILGKENVGLLVSKASSKVTKMSLAKFHDSVVKVNKIDVNGILLD